MRITVIAVGKLKERFWEDAVAEYRKRIGPYARLEIVEVPDRDPDRCGGEKAARETEAADILKACPDQAHVIALAIEGTPRSSEELSQHLDELSLQGISDICFIIGGSTGLAKSVYERADETLSFGTITLPHNLARVVLLEQLYRAFKISRGEPYHK
ncbi:MAG: 23S rRNA (pseudouridine(1915)-N(3))-methyltransferase RlmH [Coriobacteriaceae bacterium]|nr:23S rRNA (pseudouridine(1915)-N(3))-methyltransferase RlmH [Coriobacteriaceae bacterium]